ncbi:hypothetical protein IE53DRAFT_391229 [Violaceomyces palustris]|uniref:Uncharacterized protein n=1 Tax=Violaceomyces palustris TaxID=1673888 RepID=A0ACD0NLE7_9BASI|nr:hypothetical protein IE53DRAFT_391229 [Violaceomyces palustris]
MIKDHPAANHSPLLTLESPSILFGLDPVRFLSRLTRLSLLPSPTVSQKPSTGIMKVTTFLSSMLIGASMISASAIPTPAPIVPIERRQDLATIFTFTNADDFLSVLQKEASETPDVFPSASSILASVMSSLQQEYPGYSNKLSEASQSLNSVLSVESVLATATGEGAKVTATSLYSLATLGIASANPGASPSSSPSSSSSGAQSTTSALGPTLVLAAVAGAFFILV